MAEVGAARVTMDGLAARADLGKGTVFRRFGSRAGIFRRCSTTKNAHCN